MHGSEIIDVQIFGPNRETYETPREELHHSVHTTFGARYMTADTPVLDLVFAIDCTVSMELYIQDATNKAREIIRMIDSRREIDVRFALIEYRDHPPQEFTFVTRVHGFTNTVEEMNQWLGGCSAKGGGDGPEAVVDALYDALHLPWRAEAAKICIIIADAPPHGAYPEGGDLFPDGCPCGHDPMTIAREMAAKKIILYTVGVEPPIEHYRPYFQALALTTQGEYISMENAARLALMIIDGVCERSVDQ